jgi:A/G-specific adenine glycosylase
VTAAEQACAIAPALLAWHGLHGRHDLPWQRDRSAYRVWVSEVMLQQTQVATVIPYYERFMARFPDLRSLAAAPGDEVLHLWSGLGYYARARNLQRAAQVICAQHAGEFPRGFDAVAALPGIGRSTAGAILALSSGARHAILDGNVRRVLARYFGVAGASGERAFEARLWELAEQQTPVAEVAAYTQAMMDLGATVCTRRNPACERCPLQAHCSARRTATQHQFPGARRRAARRSKRTYMLIARRGRHEVLLLQRPAQGIWGGLWCLPEFAAAADAQQFLAGELGERQPHTRELPAITHAFTHFDLAITPLLSELQDAPADAAAVGEGGMRLWYNAEQPARIGLPAPVTTLLAALEQHDT